MSKTIKKKADVVVVGTGPGGATVARDLTMKGKKVIIVEWGGNLKPKGNMLGGQKYIGGMHALGKGILFTGDFLTMVRAITVGGSSMMYTGTAWNPPAATFKKYGVDLSKEVKEIRSEMSIVQVPEELIGPGAKMIRQSARDLGYKWDAIEKFLTPSKCRTNCDECWFGCKHGGKWHSRDWVVDAVEKGAELITYAYCDNAIIQNKTAVGIKATDRKGNIYEINADKVVIAAGGVGSPTVLQRSGIYDAGRKFFFDPFSLTFGYVDKKLNPSREFPMTCGTHLEKDGIVFTDMQISKIVRQSYATASLHWSKIFRNKGALCIMAKVRDDMDGSVDITGRVTKPLTSDDRYKLTKGKAISREILVNLGAKDIWYNMDCAAHPGGTCRIGAIVDSNLQTQFKNLYVADASVIPEPWGLPPVLSIICLARRLSKHISK